MTQLLPQSAALSPAQGSFSGHETFTLRYGWLKKGLDALAVDPNVFTSDDALVTLGVGKNMVRSIRHWCLATKVVEERGFHPNSRTRILAPTSVGEAIFIRPAWDAYMEDDATLWLLHWHLATNYARATTWYWVFNLFKDQEFTADELTGALGRCLESFDVKVSPSSLKSDVSCLLRTYTAIKRGPASTAEETLECPLANLGIMSASTVERRFRFCNGRKNSLPLAIFAYALLDSWSKSHSGQQTLSLREITHGPGSPGRVFRLDEDAVLGYLDGLDALTNGSLSFRDTALIRQVVRRSAMMPEEVLSGYYTA